MKEVNPETFTTDISDMNKRKAFATLKDFVLSDECYQGKILAVCGLKITGKTTLLKQLLCDIVAYTASCAFLEMQDSDTMKTLERRIEEEQAKGKTVIFINEITKVCDFINNSASLADCFAKAGVRIIISGMDSLSIAFAEDYELYDRVRKVNTTYISFAEYHTLFPSEDINDYIRYGGLFYKNEAEKSTIRYENNRYDEVGLFSGILFCADCGSVLYQQRYQNATRKQDCYICGSYKKRTRDCTAHFIRTDLLTAGVTDNLRKVTSYAAKHEARFMKLLIEQNEDGGKRRNAARKKELEAAEKRISELSAIFKRLYEDSVTGRISDERFTELSADYEAEQKELKERAAAIRAELSKAQEATVNAEKFMNVVRKYTSFEELTPTLLREFVEKIVVHECSYDENGTRRQDIDIYYSFVGKVDLPE